jgi:hypothetical protein
MPSKQRSCFKKHAIESPIEVAAIGLAISLVGLILGIVLHFCR